MAFPLVSERRRSASLSRNAAQATAPLHGATPAGDVTASRAKTRPLRHRRSAANRGERASVARTARREARAPAGQIKNTAPSRSAAAKSATLENPAHCPARLIVTRRAKTIAAEKDALIAEAKASGLSPHAFGVMMALRDEPALRAANIEARDIAAEIDALASRFPNASVNDDERRRLRGALYLPLLGLPQEDSSRLVDFIMRSMLA